LKIHVAICSCRSEWDRGCTKHGRREGFNEEDEEVIRYKQANLNGK